MTGEAFHKNSIALQISREMALDLGIVEPTEAEKRERATQRAIAANRRFSARPGILASVAALKALTGTERAVLDLHHATPSRYGFGDCEGCDFGGYEGEPPQWPCSTVELIARLHDIDVSQFHLYDEETT